MPKPPPPPDTPTPTVHGFLKAILRSGLINREALPDLLRPLPAEQRNEPEAIAEFLIRAGQLTRFQARKLLQGAPLGLVLGPFEVLAPIARGGMGTVYLARDRRSQQLLALKVLPPRRARAEERILARFRREMEMCQRVSHPNLAWTYEVGVNQGVYYIAMEYIPGKSLSRLIVEEGLLPVPRLARLAAEVALALDHAHMQGLIHRDLKPSNIMVTPNDHAKVLDLGLALMKGEATAGEREVIGGQGYIVGTMDYIAPEQTADPSKVDARCDLYSLGCSLYYALTGRHPFPGGTAKDKILRHRTEEPTPILQLNPTVPPGFVSLVQRMMAKDPADRPASAAALRIDLLAWADRGPGLPLDRPEDAGYMEAVAQVETKESSMELEATSAPDEPAPATDIPSENAPEAIPVDTSPALPQRPRPRSLSLGKREPQPRAARIPWLYYLIPVGACVLIAGVMLIYFLLWRRG
jgi:serine/threonine protein kinase